MNFSCTKDVEREKARFSKQFYSLHKNFHCMDQKVLIHLFKLHTMSFYGVQTWFMKLQTEDLNNISVACHKVKKCMCNKRPYDSNHGRLDRVNLLIFKHLFAKKIITSRLVYLNQKVHIYQATNIVFVLTLKLRQGI